MHSNTKLITYTKNFELENTKIIYSKTFILKRKKSGDKEGMGLFQVSAALEFGTLLFFDMLPITCYMGKFRLSYLLLLGAIFLRVLF